MVCSANPTGPTDGYVNYPRFWENPLNELDSFIRQADIVPAERIREISATVIGVGAIGRQVALQLAAVGVPRLQLIDFDHVELVNIPTQGYRIADVGRDKVAATANALHEINPLITTPTVVDRWRPGHKVHDVVFTCVDSISVRAAIWRGVGAASRFWADGRMLAETIRVLTVAEDQGREHYPRTLFAQAAAQRGSCTAHGTIYAASIAAGLMVHQFTRWLRGLAIEPDTVLDLIAGEITAVTTNHETAQQRNNSAVPAGIERDANQS